MTALPIQSTIDQLHGAGLVVSLTPDNGLRVSPASGITPALRELIRTHKAALVDYLLSPLDHDTEAANESIEPLQELRSQILTLAMKVCDSYGDSERARKDMRRDVLETPDHLLIDLLEHFNGEPVNHLQIQGAAT